MTAEELTKPELRLIYDHLCRTTTTPLLTAVASKIQRILAQRAMEHERGPCVLALDLPAELCPTLNEYARLTGWKREAVRKKLDPFILVAMSRWPKARIGPREPPRRRIVRVTRHSVSRCDELSIDILGGKMIVDRLVKHGVFSGDTDRWLVREPAWQPAPRGGLKISVEIFEVWGAGGLALPPPKQAGGTL